MQFLLNAYTFVATYALFDPQAIPRSDFRHKEDYIDTLLRVATTGKALAYKAKEDGNHYLLLQVDEPLEDRFQEHGEHVVTQGYIWVPSGRLVYVGWEQVQIGSKYDPDTFAPEPFESGESGECQVPVGHYSVEVFKMNWGQQLEEAAERMTSPKDFAFSKRFNRLLGFGCFSSMAIAIILIVLPSTIFAEKAFPYVAGILVVYWLLVFLYRFANSAKFDRVEDVWKRIDKEYPELVIQLTTVPQRPSQFNPLIIRLSPDSNK